MATTGETIWASLIASNKAVLDESREMRGAYLSFHFGRYQTYQTPLVPVQDFRLSDYEWMTNVKVPPGVYLHFLFKRKLGRISNQLRFKVIWPYIWKNLRHDGKGPYICKFPYRPYMVLVELSNSHVEKWATIKKIYLVNRTGQRRGSTSALTPNRLFNLSLIAGSLSPRGVKPKGIMEPKTRGPFAKKLSNPRPADDVRYEIYPAAMESTSTPYNTWTEQVEVYRRTWTGTVTPNFGSKKRSQLPDNGHTVFMQKTDYSMGYDLRKKVIAPFNYNNGWSATGYGFQHPSATVSNAVMTIVENLAIKKLNTVANQGIQANMAQNVAQYTQTTNMIAKNATNIAASVVLLRKGRISAAVDKLFENGRSVGNSIRKGNPTKSKSLANNWLELQYGWKPLLSDIDESMRLLANYMVNSTSAQQVQASAIQRRTNVIPLYGPSSATIPVGFERNITQNQCRFGCRYTVSSPTLNLLSQLGFTNPINLAWEILPWSFVVDWFIPIGPYLESLTAPHGLTFLSGYKTRFTKYSTSVRVSHHGPMPGDSTSHLRLYADRSRMSLNLVRDKLSAWPVQSFPTFKNPFSVTHALNALALVKQAFGRR
jgi:hypothetical protein